MADATPGGAQRLLAFTWVGHLPLALDGGAIVAIDAPAEDEPLVDVFELFGVACGLVPSERRVARLSREGERPLLLGDRVELGSVDDGAVLAPPALLAGLAQARGLLGFVLRSGTLFSLFDPARVTTPRDPTL